MPDYIMPHYFWLSGLMPGTFMGIVAALLCAGCLVAWGVGLRLNRAKFEAQGGLLLQIEVNGAMVAHLGMLTADARGGKPTYAWCMSQIDGGDFPYAQMPELPFSHIIVTQQRSRSPLMTITVVDRATNFSEADFYWIKDAAIGDWPGFPQKLLLPRNLVLKYFDVTSMLQEDDRPSPTSRQGSGLAGDSIAR